jgi:hypothetical protein
MADKNVRIAIPERVRAQLWVAAGGRCEFNGCNVPLDRNLLTKQRVYLAELAHIIADSPKGPRGDEERSKTLAHEAANLLLVCKRCHTTVDRLAADYDADLLRRMKKRHEDRIQRLFDIDDTKDSIPIILRHSIKRIHVPSFSEKDVRAAILTNSEFCHAPSERTVDLDYRSFAAREDDPEYWLEVARQMRDQYESQLRLSAGPEKPGHLSIFAFAPMPLNIQLGALIGNKVEASTHQWDRVAESWCFRRERQFARRAITFGRVPPANGRELALAMSLSGEVSTEAVAAGVPGLPVVRFGVPLPSPSLVEDADDVRGFRNVFTTLMAAVRNQGYRRVHVFPAMPLSLAVEFGRQLLPKVDPVVKVWDFQNVAFVRTLEVVV